MNEPNLQLTAAQKICYHSAVANDVYNWSVNFNVDLVKHGKILRANYIELLSDVLNSRLQFVKLLIK